MCWNACMHKHTQSYCNSGNIYKKLHCCVIKTAPLKGAITVQMHSKILPPTHNTHSQDTLIDFTLARELYFYNTPY